MNYWLMKSEPDVFGIDDLQRAKNKTEHWDGVRNYQARNMMRDQMKKGDLVLFYHSNCKQPGVVGLAKVVIEAYPDFTAFDPQSKYYDPKSKPDAPRWFMVDVQYVRKFKHTITLDRLKAHPDLQDLPLVRRGNRLSVMPVSPQAWETILAMESLVA